MSSYKKVKDMLKRRSWRSEHFPLSCEKESRLITHSLFPASWGFLAKKGVLCSTDITGGRSSLSQWRLQLPRGRPTNQIPRKEQGGLWTPRKQLPPPACGVHRERDRRMSARHCSTKEKPFCDSNRKTLKSCFYILYLHISTLHSILFTDHTIRLSIISLYI